MLQAAAGALADKATALVDLNERALSLRTGGVRDMDDDRDQGGRGGFGEDRGFQRRCSCPLTCSRDSEVRLPDLEASGACVVHSLLLLAGWC